MAIIAKSGEFSQVEMFKMLNGKSPKISRNVGVVFDCVGFLETSPDDDDSAPVLYIAADNGEIYATTSDTVRKTFMAMRMSFGDPTKENPIKNVVILEGESKNGRKYIDLDITE